MERELLRLLHMCKNTSQLRQIHLQMLVNGVKANFLLHNLITVSCDLISLDYAFTVLQTWNSTTDVVAYNTLIRCFVGVDRSSTTYNAMSAYKEMKARVSPNSFTFTFLLKCFDDLDVGRMIHGEVLKMGFDVSSVFVGNTLLNFYSRCGSTHGVDLACKVFDEMPERDTVSWNSVITGLAKNGKMEYARCMFDKMPVKNEVSWNCVISGYLKAGDVRKAQTMFEEMPLQSQSVVTCTAIISAYASTGDVESARKIFDRMGGKRNIVTWNAMIAGYLNNNMFDEALSLFHLLLLDGNHCKPDQITLISVLSACSHLCSLETGKWVSFYIKQNKINLSIPLGNALIDMFAKCGDIESSKTVFHRMSRKCIITWTTMVSGLASNGMCKEAISLFNKMCVQGVKPDDVMFIALLSACNHGGLVKEGRNFFNQMVSNFGIEPRIEHYGCMIDLLARAGDLEEAFRLIENMKLEPNAVIWGTLIAACKIHGNTKLFEYVTKKVLDQEHSNPSYLTLVTNLSSSIGRWEDALRFRWEMRQKGIEKVPGCSSIQIGSSVHEFVAGDTRHMKRSDIYEILESLNGHLWLEYEV